MDITKPVIEVVHRGHVYKGFVEGGNYMELGPVVLCGCTNDELEAGRCCGDADCANTAKNRVAFEGRRKVALARRRA